MTRCTIKHMSGLYNVLASGPSAMRKANTCIK